MERRAESTPPAYGQSRRVEQLGRTYQFYPVRRCGSTEQRLWLGPSEYSCSGARRFTNAHTHSDRDGNANCNRNCDADCNNVAECNTHSYAKSYTESSTDPASAAVR